MAAAELLFLLLSAGRGGRCPVWQRGGLEKSQRHSESDQPDCCAETWPSTSAVHGKIETTMVASVGLQKGLRRRKQQKQTLVDKRREEANMQVRTDMLLKVQMR